MPSYLPPLRLTGALSLRDGQMQQRSIALAAGRFTTGPYPAVDLKGYYILPGIIDLHSTGFQSPRGKGRSLLEHIDREAALQGVTTRCLSVPWSWEHADLGPCAATALALRLDAYRSDALTDLRLQLACEAILTSAQTALLELVRNSSARQVIFTDRAATVRALRETDADGFRRWAWQTGSTTEALSDALDRVLPNVGAVPRHLCELAEAFDDLSVLYGSDGDATAEKREHHSMIGARLCLNPGSARVAAAAHAVGDPVLAGADDILHPAVNRAGARVTGLIQAGLCDALVSGAQSSALVPAVFQLVNQGIMPLNKAWRLVSSLPAQIARLPDRGEIAPGKRADLTIVSHETQRVEATISGGRLSYLAGDAARRFLGLRRIEQLAAE